MRFEQPRALTVAQQYHNLRANPISEGQGELMPGRLTWRFATSPSPLSRLYSARIDFSVGKPPSVYIDDPDLTLLAGERPLPHVYDQKPTRLCLYLPRAWQWQPWMRLDLTIVPWTILWLFYFEDWLRSGEWRGGGEHPEDIPSGSRWWRRSIKRAA